MKRCPECRRDYYDDTLSFCLDDGAALLEGPSTIDEPATAFLNAGESQSESVTRLFDASPVLQPQPSIGATSATIVNSIAVLPFAHLSSSPDDEYFCDGLAEELLNALAKIDGLRVAGRTSTFSFKGKNAGVSEIGQSLGVATILDGSVRKSGDRLRVTVQLVNAGDGYQLWSERYDREMRDIFEVQDEITHSVVGTLKSKFLGEHANHELPQPFGDSKHKRTDIEAYKLYLRGRFYFNKFTPDDYYRALDCFQKALEIEPDYAKAYAGIADAHMWLTEFGPVPPREGMPRAKEAALKALALDPTLSEAHASLALVLQEFDHDFTQAEIEYKQAISLNPNDSMAQQYYGSLLGQLGRFSEAESRFRKALKLEPHSAVSNWVYPFSLFWERRYDESIDRARGILELDGDFAGAFLVQSFGYQMKEDFAASVEAYSRFLELCGMPGIAAIGRTAFEENGWQGFLRAITGQDARATISSYISAIYFAALGDRESAIACLEESFDKREGYIVMLKVDPRMEGLRDDPRFQELLKTIGFPD